MRCVRPALALALAASAATAFGANAASVTTQHVDNARTGAVLTETALTPTSVRERLRRAYERRVNGQTLANPLFVEAVPLPTGGAANLFFIATATNCLYAFDLDDERADAAPAAPADRCDTSTRAVWHRALAATGDVAICAQTSPPRVGVTSTPVIDLATHVMYVVSFHVDDHQHYLHALDIRSGADRQAPVRIGGTASGKRFDAACERNRPGLLLQDGVVYVAFGTFGCDQPCPAGPFRGWVFGYRAADLAPAGAWTSAPRGGGAGIWQSGGGLAGDGEAIYLLTGNDRGGRTPFGDSFVRLETDGASLVAAGRFTPANAARLRIGDIDLGAGGPVLLPGGKLLGGGKEGVLYLVDSRMTGKADQQFLAFRNTWHDDPKQKLCPLRHVGWRLPANGCYVPHDRYQDSELWGPNIHGTPVYWQSAASSFGYVYMQPEKEYLRLFRYDLQKHRLETTPFRSGAERAPDGMPGGAVALSANGGHDGVVWVLLENSDAQAVTAPGHLVAYDAETLKTLWRDDDPVAFAKFNPPLAVGGHLIRPTFADRVIVYGLAPSAAAAAAPAAFAPQPLQPGGDGSGAATSPLPCYSIAEKVAVLGGETGSVGTPLGAPVELDGSGRLQRFAGAESLGPFCDAPPARAKTLVFTAVVWSERTCAHMLQGEALALWLQRGAQAGDLGYPLTDEVPTADGAGRQVVFEGGEIRWTPAAGYEVVPMESAARGVKRPQRDAAPARGIGHDNGR